MNLEDGGMEFHGCFLGSTAQVRTDDSVRCILYITNDGGCAGLAAFAGPPCYQIIRML